MDGRAFLDVARRLAGGKAEADWRTAAGRAYYALMLEARSALRRWGVVPARGDQIHAFTRLKFVYSTDPALNPIGFALEHLGILRNRADYEVDQSGDFATAHRVNQAIRDAETAIALLDQIDADPARRAAAIASLRP